jgi:hypothetical protein
VDVLGRPEYAPLWTAARRRIERNGVSLEGTPLTLKGLTSNEADKIAGLLGVRRPTDGSLRVSLAELDRAHAGPRHGSSVARAPALLARRLRVASSMPICTSARRRETRP